MFVCVCVSVYLCVLTRVLTRGITRLGSDSSYDSCLEDAKLN